MLTEKYESPKNKLQLLGVSHCTEDFCLPIVLTWRVCVLCQHTEDTLMFIYCKQCPEIHSHPLLLSFSSFAGQ